MIGREGQRGEDHVFDVHLVARVVLVRLHHVKISCEENDEVFRILVAF